MRILNFKKITFVLFFFMAFCMQSFAQQADNSITQDSRFDQLLKDKRKISQSVTVNDRYKIQIFYGANDKARKALSDFKKEFKSLDGTIIFQSPTYKVLVGNFKSRLDAEKNLVDIKKKYPYALVIKPGK